MSQESLFSRRNRWFATAVALTVLIGAASLITGFIWLPVVQPNAQFRGLWDAICSAAGLVYHRLPEGIERPRGYQTSTVVMTVDLLPPASPVSIGRGATLALQCTVCHGARGLSNADTPNLAGQYAPAIYKELHDFQNRARVSAIMSAYATPLGEQDMRDLAAYYAYLPRPPAYHPVSNPAPLIVSTGAPMRSIAPCAACHGAANHKIGSPWLEGESRTYLRAQLQAFASGERHNDISEQMRNIARGMTRAEIEQAAAYYANQPP